MQAVVHSEYGPPEVLSIVDVPQPAPEPDEVLAVMPENMSFVEGAGVCDGMILAINYIRRVSLGPTDRILIYGSSGAIGTAAVQLAKNAGAHVTAVCTTKNLDLMKSLGADEVIDYTTTDFTKDGQTYDVILDAVGKHSYRRCRRVLVKRGVYMCTDLGFMWQNPFLALATRWLPVKKLYFPIPPYRQADVELLEQMFEAGKYRAVIDRTYPLADVVEATRYVDSEQKTGNVVLIIRPD